MTSTDRILGVIDAGLQHSDETSYGTDHSPDLCFRCQRLEPVEGGDLCVGCRAFLLGNSEQDPKARRRSYPREGMFENVSTDEDMAANEARFRVTVSVDTNRFSEMLRQAIPEGSLSIASIPDDGQWHAATFQDGHLEVDETPADYAALLMTGNLVRRQSQ